MAHEVRLKNQVQRLRQLGLSIPALAKVHGLAKSTVSLWVRDVQLPEALRVQLNERSTDGSVKGLAIMARRRVAQAKERLWQARQDIDMILLNVDGAFFRLMAAVLFWCEGCKGENKAPTELAFVNSDPVLMHTFLVALRRGYSLDEKKFRPRIHLHEYHDAAKQTVFWSKVTGIPEVQFRKPYIKPHTGKRQRANYPGCLSLRYGNADLAKRLIALYYCLAETIGD